MKEYYEKNKERKKRCEKITKKRVQAKSLWKYFRRRERKAKRIWKQVLCNVN